MKIIFYKQYNIVLPRHFSFSARVLLITTSISEAPSFTACRISINLAAKGVCPHGKPAATVQKGNLS